MILENFKKHIDSEKLLRLMGAKQGWRVSPASQRRIDLLQEDIETLLSPQLSYRILKLDHVRSGRIYLADGTCFKSLKLAKAISNAETVCCFLATVGPAIDMEIQRLMKRRRYADAYTLDAMGSMSVENVVDQFYQRMAQQQSEKQGAVTMRFSPGYCDWPIQQQRQLFKIFNKTDMPEVVLSDSCLMSPCKSVSGLFGLLPDGTKYADPAYNPCDMCNKKHCIARRPSKKRN